MHTSLCFLDVRLRLLGLLAVLPATVALAGPPSVDELLRRYDEVMGPKVFEAQAKMTATREDGTTRTYGMRFLKRDEDKFRVWLNEPASVKGQEILRLGDNSWVYIPNLKRATRIANRDSFQGGDFNNADVLRVNYSKDYTGEVIESDIQDTWRIKLKAKHQETAYDAIELYVRKTDFQPVKGKYFGTSGQMVRSAEFSEYKTFDKDYVRPARVIMQNEIVKARKSEFVFTSIKLNVEAPPQRFVQSDLGK